MDRGIFECFFDIRWGTSPSSRGGALRILIPQTPAGSMEAVGMGSYWSAAGQFGMDIYPFVAIGGREIRFMTPRNGNLLLQSEFQIWDGRNVKDTGIPANPGFILDANGSSLKGNIRFPV
ncbi:hypothetical protein [Corynebacterium mastitidis]|uniref:hypothetical protein n=1 Tax=Corynebacterium mastitidis TaxID=161890 RepID=UPI00254C086A|nr:hypothetical protein [Corynebacterium mastitidis]